MYRTRVTFTPSENNDERWFHEYRQRLVWTLTMTGSDGARGVKQSSLATEGKMSNWLIFLYTHWYVDCELNYFFFLPPPDCALCVTTSTCCHIRSSATCIKWPDICFTTTYTIVQSIPVQKYNTFNLACQDERRGNWEHSKVHKQRTLDNKNTKK